MSNAVHVPLSGDRPTAELPKITKNDPVTVTVARTVAAGRETAFLRWADELFSVAREQFGYLGGGVLHPGREGGEYQIVMRFIDANHLRDWERSEKRVSLLAIADDFVESSRAVAVVGNDTFLELSEHAQPIRKFPFGVVEDVMWIYPVALVVGVALTPLTAGMPLLARSLVSCATITLLAHIAVSPLRRRIRRLQRTL